ncbi:hypothetical protein ACFU6K_09405 [Kitasatospora sp. NPDC057512]|uniref:hypothetical protein n=1 Tax=Kitasatospora sp. NPDC057512 TaxID=3346154 RepID=UPI0036A69ADB
MPDATKELLDKAKSRAEQAAREGLVKGLLAVGCPPSVANALMGKMSDSSPGAGKGLEIGIGVEGRASLSAESKVLGGAMLNAGSAKTKFGAGIDLGAGPRSDHGSPRERSESSADRLDVEDRTLENREGRSRNGLGGLIGERNPLYSDTLPRLHDLVDTSHSRNSSAIERINQGIGDTARLDEHSRFPSPLDSTALEKRPLSRT